MYYNYFIIYLFSKSRFLVLKVETTAVAFPRKSVLKHSMLSHIQLSLVQLFTITQTVAHQAPLSVEFSRHEYWGVLPFSAAEALSNPRIEPKSLEYPALAGGFFTTSATWEALMHSKPCFHSYEAA